MAVGRCSNRRKRFSQLTKVEVVTCYSPLVKDKDAKIFQSGKEFELSKLQQMVNKAVQQHPDSIKQNKVTGVCLKQQNEILQEEVESASCLLEMQNQRVEESITENGKPNMQNQELNKELRDLQETNIKLGQEKEEQGKEFESIHAELAKKNRELEEKIIALLKENEEQQKVIDSLQEDNAIERSQEISEERTFLEEENIELGRRNLVLEEKQVQLEGRIDELERTLNSLNMDFESCRLIADEKEALLIDLQYQLSDLLKENICLEELNSSLVTELNKCTTVLEENVYLHHKIRELDISYHSLNEELEHKDILVQQLKSEYQHFQSVVLAEDGKPDGVHDKTKLKKEHGYEKTKLKSVHGNGMPESRDIRVQVTA